MNKLLILILGLFIISCQNSQPNIETAPSIITGKIINSQEEELKIRGVDLKGNITISEDGTFMDTLESGGYYSLYYGREEINIYLSEGEQVNILADGSDFKESLRFDGEGSNSENYLLSKSILLDSVQGKRSDFFILDQQDFLDKTNAISEALTAHLESTPDLSDKFIQLEKKDIHFEKLSYLANYQNAHRFYAEDEAFEESGDFKKMIEKEDLDNESNYKNLPAYRSLVYYQYGEKLFGEQALETMYELQKLKAPSIKSYFGEMIAYNISPGNENNELLFEGVNQMVTNEEFKVELQEKYEKVKKLAAGNPSPFFADYEDHSGGTKSLSDFQGKFVYIDVWATWCGPCIREIPALKEIEKNYHDKNIEFVSISIDKQKDHEKWIKMVNDKELVGTQLMADKDWDSDFVKDYAINGIPRFILIDPDGNIVSGDAPRPSDEKLPEFFTNSGI